MIGGEEGDNKGGKGSGKYSGMRQGVRSKEEEKQDTENGEEGAGGKQGSFLGVVSINVFNGEWRKHEISRYHEMAVGGDVVEMEEKG